MKGPDALREMPSVARAAVYFVVVCLVVVAILVGGRARQMHNRGENTTCPVFLKMSPSKRTQVIARMGFTGRAGPVWTRATVTGCRKAQGTSDQDDPIWIIDGP